MRKVLFGASLAGLVGLAGSASAQTSATATAELNIRSGPGPQFEVVGVIPADGDVRLVDCGDDGRWCRIEQDGVEGWASGGYLTVEQQSERVVIIERRQDIAVPVVGYEGHTAEGAAAGIVTGAATGALVGGPIGAAIGGAAGAIIGAATNLPEPVVSYVRENRTETVYLDGEVVVGAELPESVALVPVPDSQFRYVYVNNVPAVVGPDDRRIVRILR